MDFRAGSTWRYRLATHRCKFWFCNLARVGLSWEYRLARALRRAIANSGLLRSFPAILIQLQQPSNFNSYLANTCTRDLNRRKSERGQILKVSQQMELRFIGRKTIYQYKLMSRRIHSLTVICVHFSSVGRFPILWPYALHRAAHSRAVYQNRLPRRHGVGSPDVRPGTFPLVVRDCGLPAFFNLLRSIRLRYELLLLPICVDFKRVLQQEARICQRDWPIRVWHRDSGAGAVDELFNRHVSLAGNSADSLCNKCSSSLGWLDLFRRPGPFEESRRKLVNRATENFHHGSPEKQGLRPLDYICWSRAVWILHSVRSSGESFIVWCATLRPSLARTTTSSKPSSSSNVLSDVFYINPFIVTSTFMRGPCFTESPTF